MGDGRYYTNNQFFIITFLTMMIIAVTFYIVISIYKSKTSIDDRINVAMLVCLDVILVLKFIEELYMVQEICQILRACQQFIFLYLFLLFAYYLCVIYLNLKRQKMVRMLLIPSLGLFIIMAIYFKLIDSYTFNSVLYARTYGIILLACLSDVIIICMTIVFDKQKSGELNRNKWILSIIFVLLIMPSIAYAVLAIRNIRHLNLTEILLIALILTTLHTISKSKISYGFTPFTFDKIKGVMSGYVLVANLKGDIVFINDNIKNSDIFNDIHNIKNHDIDILFKYDIVLNKIKDGLEYIEIQKPDEKIYLSYKIDEIKSRNRVTDKIITFIDISNLIELLYKIKAKELKNSIANKKLYKYKQVVYEVEKEKEINLLLGQILESEEKNMFEIMGRIDSLDIDNDDFRFNLDKIIALANKNHEQVRRAVSTFRAYYGGKG